MHQFDRPPPDRPEGAAADGDAASKEGALWSSGPVKQRSKGNSLFSAPSETSRTSLRLWRITKNKNIKRAAACLPDAQKVCVHMRVCVHVCVHVLVFATY